MASLKDREEKFPQFTLCELEPVNTEQEEHLQVSDWNTVFQPTGEAAMTWSSELCDIGCAWTHSGKFGWISSLKKKKNEEAVVHGVARLGHHLSFNDSSVSCEHKVWAPAQSLW